MNLLKKLANFVWSKAFLINFGVLIVLYISVFMITKSCIKSSTHWGERVEVPNLIGKNANVVENLLKGTDLKFEILDSIYDPSKVSGTVMYQDPNATSGTDIYVKKGRTIRLRVSKRSMSVELPNLIDKSQRFAEGVLRNREFRYNIKYVPSKESHGAVIDQKYKGKSVKGGVKLAIGSRITLVVGRNEAGIPLPLPNLNGLTIVEAKQRVESMLNMTFFVGSCEGCVTSADSSIARVYTQSPEYIEGEIVSSGSSITVGAKKNYVEPIPQ